MSKSLNPEKIAHRVVQAWTNCIYFFLAVSVFQLSVDLLHSNWDKMKSQSCVICIFLITRDAEHFLRCVLAMFSSFKNSLFRS